jgi:hypothetical protein
MQYGTVVMKQLVPVPYVLAKCWSGGAEEDYEKRNDSLSSG